MAGTTVFVPVDSIASGGGPLLLADGTAAAPAYSFLSDSDTGAYRVSANTYGISCGGSLQASISSTGIVAAASGFLAAAAGAFAFGSSSQLKAPSDGIITLLNNGGTAFTRLQFGGTAATFPAIKRNATALNFRLADDSADAPVTFSTMTASGDATFSTNLLPAAASLIKWAGRAQADSPADGQLRVQLNAGGQTTLSTGLVIGTTNSLVYDATFGLRSMNADQTGNQGFAGTSFSATNSNAFYGFSTGTTCGLNITSTTALDIRTNSTVGIAMDTSQNVALGTATGRVQVVSAGSTTVPAIRMGGEETGLYLPASGQIGFVGAGAVIMRFENLSSSVRFKNLIGSSDNGFSWYSSNDSRLIAVDGTNGLILNSRDGMIVRGGSSNTGQQTFITQNNTTTAALSGATVTCTNLIPAGVWVVGVTIRVTTTVTGATSFDIGDGTDVDRWGAATALPSGTTTTLVNTTITSMPLYTAATSVVLTANGSNFTGGVVRVSVHYLSVGAQTS